MEVGLQRFSREAIATFQKIEEPEDWLRSAGPPFTSIGEFYEFVTERLIGACLALGESNVFTGNPARQILREEYYYGAGGQAAPVHSLNDAKDVLAQVAEQGEGRRNISNVTGDRERFGQPKEVAHYFRFTQILHGRYYERDDDLSAAPTGPAFEVDWTAVHAMQPNPRPGGSGPPGIENLLRRFDESYAELLRCLHIGFNSDKTALAKAVGAMHELRHQTLALMNVPTAQNQTYGPPFWYIYSPP
jgi:hypothetical protein